MADNGNIVSGGPFKGDKIKHLEERREDSYKIARESSNRTDALIVAISGAGIYVCLETLKYLGMNGVCLNWPIKIAGVIFLLAIVASFLSQITADVANFQDYLAADSSLKKVFTKADAYHKVTMKYDSITGVLNKLATGLMLLGLTCTVLYFLTAF